MEDEYELLSPVLRTNYCDDKYIPHYLIHFPELEPEAM